MYYKLPVKERIELMKSYKKANPDMSYQDMVNDYNTSYQKFDNGGKSNGMTGMMKAKIATEAHYRNPAALRMVSPNPKTGMTPEGIGTHYMTSMDEYAVPLLQDFGNKNLKLVDGRTPSSEDFKFSRPEDAEYFAEHYKEVAPMMRSYEKFGDGGKNKINLNLKNQESNIPLSTWNQNIDWLGEKYNDVGLNFNKNNLNIGIGNYIPRNTFEKIGNINPYLNMSYDLNDKNSISGSFSKDYNGVSFIHKFDNGGKKEREPIYVTDKNDYKLRAYNDSLKLYNLDQKYFKELDKQNKDVQKKVDLKYYNASNIFKDLQYENRKDLQKTINDVANYENKRNKNIKNEPNETTKFQTFAPTIINTITKSDFIKGYKKPVQPYIYKKPEEQPIVNNTVQDSVKYLPLIKTIPTLTDSVRQPEIIQSALKQPEQKSTYQKVSFRYDPVSKLQVPVLLTDPKMKVEQGTRIYNKYIPTATGALPSDFKPEFNKAEVYEKTDPYWRSKFINPNSVVKK